MAVALKSEKGYFSSNYGYSHDTRMAAPYFNGRQDSGRDRGDRYESRERVGSAYSQMVDHDKPPFSRLFVVCGKRHSADDLRKVFEPYGTVEDVWVVKDKNTKENRGIAYVKFSKMSEACLAVEGMDGKKITDEDEGHLKVIIAQPKSSKSNEDFSDETALTRLFVVIPKGTEEDELRSIFQEFGEIDYVQVVKDRKTGEKKGFGYVKYYRSYDAAMAIENVDRSFKAVMAEPKSVKIKREMAQSEMIGIGSRHVAVNNAIDNPIGFGSGRRDVPTPFQMPSFGFQEEVRGSSAIGNRLQVQVSPSVSPDQLARLFDLIPGMELCDLKRNFSTGESKGIAVVVYNSVGSAIYAKEKLNGFEYPPGCKLIVRYASEDDDGAMPQMTDGGMGGMQMGGGSSYCSVSLPPSKPLANSDNEACAERLFVVCHPSPPPSNVLVDVFSRFGDLLDVYMLKNKNFGYAKYASADAAQYAKQTLHGAEIFGKKLKVLTADPPKSAEESARKRPRT